MEGILTIVHGIAWFSAALGASVSAIFVVYAGFLYMSSQGDPQKAAQARSALIGVAVGLTIIGGGFIIPMMISKYVIEPAGGIRVDPRAQSDCDGFLKNQLVFQRNVTDHERMQFLIKQIQGRQAGCEREFWNPQVKQAHGYTVGCPAEGDSQRDDIGGVYVPDGLRNSSNIKNISSRDSDNNILVFFVHPNDTGVDEDRRGLPADSSICWLYVSSFSTWGQEYLPDTYHSDEEELDWGTTPPD